MTVYRNASIDTNEQANALHFARGQNALGGAGSIGISMPGFSDTAVVMVTPDTVNLGLTGPIQADYTLGVITIASLAGAADAGAVVNWVIFD